MRVSWMKWDLERFRLDLLITMEMKRVLLQKLVKHFVRATAQMFAR